MTDCVQDGALDCPETIAALRRFVARRVDPDSSDDVLGDVLLRLTRHRDDLDAARCPVAWMYRVTANAIADHHRRRAVESRYRDFGPVPDAAAVTEGDVNPIDEMAPCVMPVLRTLPDADREALLLTDIGGLTQNAAARRLGLSVSGMKSRVQRARSRLRDAIVSRCAVERDVRGAVSRVSPSAACCEEARGTGT